VWQVERGGIGPQDRLGTDPGPARPPGGFRQRRPTPAATGLQQPSPRWDMSSLAA
jgi:hypothetical protein